MVAINPQYKQRELGVARYLIPGVEVLVGLDTAYSLFHRSASHTRPRSDPDPVGGCLCAERLEPGQPAE